LQLYNIINRIVNKEEDCAIEANDSLACASTAPGGFILRRNQKNEGWQEIDPSKGSDGPVFALS